MLRTARRDSECYANDEGDIWKSINSRKYCTDCHFVNHDSDEVDDRNRKLLKITRPLTSSAQKSNSIVAPF